MPTQVKIPTSVHTLNSWSPSGGTSVGVVTDASDGTLMTNGGAALDDLLYEFENISSSDGAPVTSCVLTMRCLFDVHDGSIFTTPRARVSGAMNSGTNFSSAPAGGYVNGAQNWVSLVNTVGLFNSSQFGIRCNWQPWPYLVELSASVTFASPGGDQVILIISWLGTIVSVGLHEIPGLCARIAKLSRGRLRFSPEEHFEIYRALREYRFSTHFDLGAF